MNTREAKNIQITSILESLNLKPEYEKRGELVYLSPLREENTASLFVNPSKNVWKDFGSGKGGTIIDFICCLKNCSVSDALKYLQNVEYHKSSFSFSQSNTIKSQAILLNKVKKLENVALIQYLKSRSISLEKAQLVLEEAYYTINDKRYFAVCLKNDSDGYELRNKYFKGSTSPKDITTLIGKNHTRLNLFEGFADYLSVLEYFNTQRLKYDTIILNSASLLGRVINLPIDYESINYFGDNDKTGNEIFKQLAISCRSVIDQRYLYKPHKDFNQFIIELNNEKRK